MISIENCVLKCYFVWIWNDILSTITSLHENYFLQIHSSFPICLWIIIILTTQEHNNVFNHRQWGCSFNSLFKLTTVMPSNLHINGSFWRESTGDQLLPLIYREWCGKQFPAMKSSCSLHISLHDIAYITMFLTQITAQVCIYHSISKCGR